MPKFQLLKELLLRDRVIHPNQIYQPGAPPREWLMLVHDAGYVRDYCEGTLDSKAQRRIGLPWSEGLVRRTCTAVGGTILTAKLALQQGIACNTAGGTHHAFPSYGSGFCIFNDLAIALKVLQAQKLIRTALIVDLDVHQGDGNAFIFQHDQSVFTFSMHCGVNFPGRKQQSDLDVPLAEGMGDEDYLAVLRFHLPALLTRLQPDIVLYDAGVDVHKDDRLGKLALTDGGIYERDRTVLQACKTGGYPVCCVIGGGYCEDMDALIYRHSLLHRATKAVWTP
ncbi:MAG: histone deacetylase [Phormidesmis priestleyi]|uniref:Histone deacetylase n=1 Tax=Phormidesmis priestleyi TaxID=268141 RepID=A0A2W4XAL9_9CYAN|nr:MAG: histone deacetylase [Phormidesmis priestleyi]